MNGKTLGALLLLLLAGLATAAETPAAKAARLRDESSTAWNEGRYGDAAELLRRADAIYQEADGEFLPERAITLRALCWNLVKSGEDEAALEVFERLSDLVRGRASLDGEVFRAYQAMYDGATRAEAPGKYLAPARAIARRHDRDGIAAQALHDTAFLLFEAGRTEEAEEAYESAIRERRKIRDDLGLAWSRVNLANLLLTQDRLEDALGPLSEAFRAVRDERAPLGPPHPALATNLRDALGRIAKLEEPGKKTVDWLWWMAGTATVDGPRILPAHVFFRAVLAADPSPRTAERVAKAELPGRPPEARADLVIRAARLAISTGAARRARPWLDGLDVGEGPAARHLAARRATVLALVSAAEDEKRRFPDEARAAANAWDGIGDFAGRRAALGELADAARELGLEAALEDLILAAAEARRSGGPGGAGGSASASGDTSGAANLGLLDPLFELTFADGRVLVRDLVAGAETSKALSWSPKPVGLNGLSLVFFGGYVRVRGLSYGVSASSAGAPGTLTLDEMDEYFPLPATGRLVILKNGAVDDRE